PHPIRSLDDNEGLGGFYERQARQESPTLRSACKACQQPTPILRVLKRVAGKDQVVKLGQASRFITRELDPRQQCASGLADLRKVLHGVFENELGQHGLSNYSVIAKPAAPIEQRNTIVSNAVACQHVSES